MIDLPPGHLVGRLAPVLVRDKKKPYTIPYLGTWEHYVSLVLVTKHSTAVK